MSAPNSPSKNQRNKNILNNTRIIACATVIEEMLPKLPEGLTYEVLDFGLHLKPENLKEELQIAID